MNLNIESLFSVKDKVGIVSGGSRGIGEMIASGFLSNGAKVYITARKEDALISKANELAKKFNIECIPFSVDLSSLDGIKNLKGELTIIVISHDDNSLKVCDEIIDLDKELIK